MKAKMKDNLIMRYQQCKSFDYRNKGIAYDCMNELQAVKQESWLDYVKTKEFLKSIEGKVVELTFTGGDAFELNDNNYWLPDELWEAI
jgi:hypothetical protein